MARNPKTGAPIRIMQLETPLWRDQKTLVWLDGAAAAAAAAGTTTIDRWDVGATSVEAAQQLIAAGVRVDVTLCLDDDIAAVEEWFRSGGWANGGLMVIPRSLAVHIGYERLATYKVRTLMCLEELAEIFPYSGPVWGGTLEDAKLLVALTLRLSRTMPLRCQDVVPSRRAIAENVGLEMGGELIAAPALWFLTQYYEPTKAKRRKEIRACLEKNLANPLVDRVVLLNEDDNGAAVAGPSGKLYQKVIGKRLTYADVLRWIRDEAPPNTLIAFANADIFLDTETTRLLWSVDLDKVARVLALLRWDVEDTSDASIAAAKLFGPRPDSQDTWIVNSSAVKRLFADQTDWSAFDFPFGKGGCDNAIGVEMMRKKFQVTNPALTLKTFHYHTSQVRTYDPKDIVDKPTYLYLQPVGLQDMRPLTKSMPGVQPPLKPTPFARKVQGPLTAAQAATFCRMVSRSTNGEVELNPDDENMWAAPTVPLYRVGNAFQSRDGLPFTYSELLIGPSKAAADAWSSAQLSSLSASVKAATSIAAPLSNATAASASAYVTQYLSKILLLRERFQMPDAEFWADKSDAMTDVLRMFRLSTDPTAEVPVLSRSETAQAWCQDLAVWLPQDGPSGLITREEVGALRRSFGVAGGWLETPDSERRLVIVVDGKWLTEEMGEAIEDAVAAAAAAAAEPITVKYIWNGRTNREAMVRALRGAWGLVVAATAEAAAWSWVMPQGSFVWEIQSEMEPSATLLHAASAAEVEHRLCIVSKGQPTAQERAAIAEKLSSSILIDAMPKPEGLADIRTPKDAPVALLMPTGHSGFFAHAGDSFREMARLWEEKGYVRIQETAAVKQIWLGGVGDTLLYDRPTLDWYIAAPLQEKRWKRALFGNPAPLGARGHAWTFWPRRPRLVEELVAAGVGSAAYEARSQSLVFYGRSENQIQKENRSRADWSKVCSDFHHSEGPAGAYLFSPKEYLERLADSRFGLCLAGYGNKCHREIECMAMGCVPVCAPEVDMDNYADPPQVGVHYFRVKSPQEAAHVIQNTTPERWAQMSAAARVWWRRNASAEGAWELTAGLHLLPSPA